MIKSRPLIFLVLLLLFAACSTAPTLKAPDLGGLYNELAQSEDPYRNPIILIPGLLGSKLIEPDSGTIVWGTFGAGGLNPNRADGARLFSLPMQKAKSLQELQDTVRPAPWTGSWSISAVIRSSRILMPIF